MSSKDRAPKEHNPISIAAAGPDIKNPGPATTSYQRDISGSEQPGSDLRNRPGTGIALKLASVCMFLTMAALLKASEGVPPGELVFFRSFFAIPPILLFLTMRRELAAGMKTTRPFGHFWRGLGGTLALGLGFYALTQLPLPEVTAIGYMAPLLVVALSAVVLRETVRLYRWTAVVLGLVGLIIITLPRLTVFGENGDLGSSSLGAAAALLSACFAAGTALMVRSLVNTERSGTIVFYFSVTSTLLSLLTFPFGWVMPTSQQAVMLISAGFAGGIGQILLTEAYRRADLSVIAPFEYTSLIFSIVVGYWVFGEVPTAPMIYGSFIVAGAGIFIILREHQLGLARARARRVSTPQG